MECLSSSRRATSKPLISRSISEGFTSSKETPLYNALCMLQIDESVAHGYIVLLGGHGGNNDPDDHDEASITVGFLALMEGNVLDACFGVKSSYSKDKDVRGRQVVKEAKALIANAADSNDGIERLAVLAYREGFRAVCRYQKRLSRRNCFTCCFRSKRYRKDALADLKAAFVVLHEAIQAAL